MFYFWAAQLIEDELLQLSYALFERREKIWDLYLSDFQNFQRHKFNQHLRKGHQQEFT